MAQNREEQLKEISERLEQGVKDYFTDKNYVTYLNTMAQFHNYSFNNTLLIAMQKPEATLVAGYQAWQKKFERHVKKGEKGIQIIAPAPVKQKEEVEKIDPLTNEPILKENGQPETEIVEMVIPRFRVTTVFDVSQTEGKPLPEWDVNDLTADVAHYEEYMQAIISASPVPVRYDEIEGEAHGYYHQVNKEIVIQNGMSESQTMKTAIHEVVHARLHDKESMEEQGIRKDKLTREVEAESTAYVVCQYFGLDTSDYSFPYIASWSSGRDMKELKDSVDTVRRTAGEMIRDISEQIKELQQEHEEKNHLLGNELVLKISGSMGSEYSYNVIENMEKEELLVQLKSYLELYGESGEKELEDFLEEQGAVVIPWYASNGYMEENPVNFYDVEYDFDTGVTDVNDLPAMGFAAMLIDRAEYNDTIFNDDERNLIMNYAFKMDDKKAVETLIEELREAQEDPDMQGSRRVRMAVQAEIDSFPDSMVGISEMHQYGYLYNGMLPLGKEKAEELFGRGYTIYALHPDGSESEIIEPEELAAHDGLYGVEKERWERHLDALEKFKTEKFQEVDIFEIPALYSNGRVDDDVLSDGIYRYDLRGSDYDSNMPVTMEKNVFVNHAATILTTAEIPLPEKGYIHLGEEINFTDGVLTIAEYQKNMERFPFEAWKEAMDNAMGRADEGILLSGNENRYAIYQLDHDGAGRDKSFWGMDYLKEKGLSVDASEYGLVYSGRLKETDTLDSLYEKFNLHHPEDFRGHSLSVSDVVVLLQDGKATGYFVDRFGFTEVPEFVNQREAVHQRNLLIEMNQIVTEATEGLEVEQHSGTWHTAEVKEINGEKFFRMEHDEFGRDVAGVVVNETGELVAQEVEHEFDQEVMETIGEYFKERGVAYPAEQDIENADISISAEPNYPPVYYHSLIYATGNKEADAYLDSRKLNLNCKKEIEDAIADHFDGLHLDHDVAVPVLDKYGAERVSFVLATTLQKLSHDGRFSRSNKEWADSFSIPENIGRGTVDLNADYIVQSHPAVLDGFVDLVRKELLERVQEAEKSFVGRYYVIEDLQKQGPFDIEYFTDYDEALEAYFSIENHMMKAFGVENSNPLPGSLDFIQCRNGIDEVVYDYTKVEGWDNLEIRELLNRLENDLSMHDTEIAYAAGEKYFTIQTVADGYDYTIYDKKLKELDGGVYDNTELSIKEAIGEILSDEKIEWENCKVIDHEKFMEDIEIAAMSLGLPDADKFQKYDGVAFKMGYGYLTVQTVEEGYSYIAYDSDYKEIDGGILEEPEISIYQASYMICNDIMGDDTKLESVDYDKFVQTTLQKTKERLNDGTFTPTSEIGRPEASLNGASRAEIEETVLCFAQAEIDKMGLSDEVKLLGARVIGSRTRDGLYHADSDIDVVLSYSGNIREDAFFNVLHESGMSIAGMVLDVNPISVEQTATLSEYLENSEKYLDEKEAEMAAKNVTEKGNVVKQDNEKPEPTISFFFAECREFPVLGEFHEGITLEEAVDYYNKIPSERLSGIKSVGFNLQDGSIYDGNFDLFSGGEILYQDIEDITHYKESLLVQKAISDLEGMVERGEIYNAKPLYKEETAQKSVTEKVQTPTQEQPVKGESGNGKRESVLKALRERQAKIKEQEKEKSQDKSQVKKGDMEL